MSDAIRGMSRCNRAGPGSRADLVSAGEGQRCPPDGGVLAEYLPMLRAVAFSHDRTADRDDVAQEVIVRALGAKSLPCDRQRLRRYLGRVARNVCIDWRRARRRRPAQLPLDEQLVGSVDRGLERLFERAELDAALDSLPPEQRRLLRWRYCEGQGYGEIARRVGGSPNAAAVAVHRARQKVRARRERPAGEPPTSGR